MEGWGKGSVMSGGGRGGGGRLWWGSRAGGKGFVMRRGWFVMKG